MRDLKTSNRIKTVCAGWKETVILESLFPFKTCFVLLSQALITIRSADRFLADDVTIFYLEGKSDTDIGHWPYCSAFRPTDPFVVVK